MKPFRYRILAEWSEEDRAFIARVPALDGCAAHGKTPEAAVRQATTAARGILESLRAHGDPVPPEDATAEYSGQVRLRLPRSLHARLARLASAEGVSLNHEFVSLLAAGCGRQEALSARRTGAGRRRSPA